MVEKRAKQLDAEERLNPSVKHGLFLGGWGKNPPWPFQVITDRQGKDSGAVALCAPFIKYYYNVSRFPNMPQPCMPTDGTTCLRVAQSAAAPSPCVRCLTPECCRLRRRRASSGG